VIAVLGLFASAAHAAPTPVPATPPAALLEPVVAPPRPPADPARLALATELVTLLMPPEMARANLEASMAQAMSGLRQQLAMAPMRAALMAAGVAEGESRRFSPATFRRLTAILDPAFEARQRLLADITTKSVLAVAIEFEPQFRAATAEAYARQLSLADLGAVVAFLKTPAGQAFAPLPATINTDPAIAERQQAMRPAFDRMQPAMLTAMRDATRKLPPPRRYADLNESEKAEMQRLINATSALPVRETPAPVAPGPGTQAPAAPARPPTSAQPAVRSQGLS
jgi:hypothetical protein